MAGRTMMADDGDRVGGAEHTVLGDWLGTWFDASLSRDAVRSMTEISQRGLDAAASIVERMTANVDGRRDGSSAGATPHARDQSGPSLDRLRTDAVRAIEVWAGAMVELVDTAIDAFTGATRAASDEELLIGPLAPGERGEGAVHVHGARGQGLIRFEVGSLESARGHGMPKDAAAVVPDAVAEGDSTVPVLVVDVPVDAVPGRYHGYVFAMAADDVSIPVTVVVTPPPPSPGTST